jgi:hypothetical protein
MHFTVDLFVFLRQSRFDAYSGLPFSAAAARPA